MWCYLIIACFDWKIGVFQQIVLRVYYILKLFCMSKCSDTVQNISPLRKTFLQGSCNTFKTRFVYILDNRSIAK